MKFNETIAKSWCFCRFPLWGTTKYSNPGLLIYLAASSPDLELFLPIDELSTCSNNLLLGLLDAPSSPLASTFVFWFVHLVHLRLNYFLKYFSFLHLCRTLCIRCACTSCLWPTWILLLGIHAILFFNSCALSLCNLFSCQLDKPTGYLSFGFFIWVVVFDASNSVRL